VKSIVKPISREPHALKGMSTNSWFIRCVVTW